MGGCSLKGPPFPPRYKDTRASMRDVRASLRKTENLEGSVPLKDSCVDPRAASIFDKSKLV